jgi:hypothetical protein
MGHGQLAGCTLLSALMGEWYFDVPLLPRSVAQLAELAGEADESTSSRSAGNQEFVGICNRAPPVNINTAACGVKAH